MSNRMKRDDKSKPTLRQARSKLVDEAMRVFEKYGRVYVVGGKIIPDHLYEVVQAESEASGLPPSLMDNEE